MAAYNYKAPFDDRSSMASVESWKFIVGYALHPKPGTYDPLVVGCNPLKHEASGARGTVYDSLRGPKALDPKPRQTKP